MESFPKYSKMPLFCPHMGFPIEFLLPHPLNKFFECLLSPNFLTEIEKFAISDKHVEW